jgi:hypothetical protein
MCDYIHLFDVLLFELNFINPNGLNSLGGVLLIKVSLPHGNWNSS